jgi:hypothetical protein
MWVGFIFSFFWMLDYYVINSVYYAATLGFLDTIYIFGATFGVVTAWILGPHGEQGTSNENYASGKSSNLFAFLGSIFILISFPRLNGTAFEGYENKLTGDGTGPSDPMKARAEIGTYLAIAFGGFASMMMSAITHSGKFKMEDFIRSLIASALCMTGIHAAMIPLWGMLLIILPIGLLAPVYHRFITPALRKFLRLQDSAGCLATWLLPALYASIWSWLFPLFFSDNIQDEDYKTFFPRGAGQWERAKWRNGLVQLCATLTAIFLGAIGGLLAGAIKIPMAWAALEEPFDDDALFAKGDNSGDE